MISFKHIRNLHKWPGILFLFPAFLISITAILLALDGVLHLNKVKVNIPTMSQQMGNAEIKAMVATPTHQYIGTKAGVIVYHNRQSFSIPELAGNDIKSLLLFGDTLFIASKQGLWYYYNNIAKRIFEQDVTNVSLAPKKLLLVSLGRKGYKLIDFNGKEVKSEAGINIKDAAFAQKQPQTLHKLLMDLHTGEAIVGKTLKPWWIAICGIQLLLLTLTGFWFVFKKKNKKAQNLV